MSTRRARKRVIAEINVVPYIDVMLVLLVIFIITAPLFYQGVEVELPRAVAEPLLRDEQEPLVLTIDRLGSYYLNLADDPTQPLEAGAVATRTAAVLRLNPQLPVLVRADRDLDYGAVINAMVLLQRAGAGKVGLSTETPQLQ
jgi:biopolymer transport protein TolR